jgi:hypothetical protein
MRFIPQLACAIIALTFSGCALAHFGDANARVPFTAANVKGLSVFRPSTHPRERYRLFFEDPAKFRDWFKSTGGPAITKPDDVAQLIDGLDFGTPTDLTDYGPGLAGFAVVQMSDGELALMYGYGNWDYISVPGHKAEAYGILQNHRQAWIDAAQ